MRRRGRWTIEDEAARTFALVFYATLLGFPLKDVRPDFEARKLEDEAPQTIQVAMERARAAIAGQKKGADEDEGEGAGEEWKNDGNPSFRLFRHEGATDASGSSSPK